MEEEPYLIAGLWNNGQPPTEWTVVQRRSDSDVFGWWIFSETRGTREDCQRWIDKHTEGGG